MVNTAQKGDIGQTVEVDLQFHNKDPEGGMVSVKNNMEDAADTII